MISVVMACHNGTAYIEKQLLSVAAQTRLPDEVIICDDCSDDGTAELCENFIKEHKLSGWQVYKNAHNMGFCLNFFGAMEKAKGDIVFLCDQDDIWLPEKIEKMAAEMEKDKEILCLACRYDIIDKNDNLLPRSSVRYAEFKEQDKFTDITVNSLIGCSWIRGFSMCYSSALKPYLKPLELKDLLAHDWLINITAAGAGKARFINTVLTNYRSHGNNASLSAGRSRRRRIDGLSQSVAAHEYVLGLDLKNLTLKDKKSLSRQIRFEKKRLAAIKNKNIFIWAFLVTSLSRYRRYYKGFASGIRVWLGDLAYILRKD